MLQSDLDGSYTRLASTGDNFTADDARLYVRFRSEAVLDAQATHGYTKEDGTKVPPAGRPIYKDVDFVTIRVPGDRETVIDREAWPSDKERFYKQYEAYKRGQADVGEGGTPIKEWPGVTRGQAEELVFLGVRTVEALAAMNDANGQRIMGFNALRQKAKDYLAAAASSAPMEAVRSELTQLASENAALKAQMQELLAAKAKDKDESAKARK